MALAHFHMYGSSSSARDEFIILQRDVARLSEKSLSIQFRMLFGQHALSCFVPWDIWGNSKLVVSNLFVCDKSV